MDTAQKETLDTLIASLPITYSAVFIPQSQSRNAGEKQPSLNWKITIASKGIGLFDTKGLTTDYMQGIGHLPKDSFYANNPHLQNKLITEEEIKNIRETGKYSVGGKNVSYCLQKALPAPALKDVLYSLIMDSDVLNYTGFEDWAGNFGYDTDSRKGEKLYQDCLAIALKLKALLGNETIEALQAAFQDY